MFGPVNKKYSALDDSALIDQYNKTGDLEFLGTLYHRYMHLVYGVSLKYFKDTEESKDAVMQIFEKLVKKVSQQEILNFKSWLYVVTKNHCLTALRKQRFKSDIEALIMESDHLVHPNGEQQDDREFKLSQALENLPLQQQRCVRLFYYQNLSYQEIAEETGYELKKVKSHIQNGKRNLKIYLDQHER